MNELYKNGNLANKRESTGYRTESSKTNQTLLLVGRNSAFHAKNMDDYSYESITVDNYIKARYWLEKVIGTPEKYPCAIIYDLEMLDATDYSFLNFIRSNDQLKDIPFIVISNNFTKIDPTNALSSGIDDFYTFPFNHIDLHRRISFLIKYKKDRKKVAEKIADHQYSQQIPVLKRAFDISVASIVLLMLSPLMALIAVLIKLESKGPIFYISKRAGAGYKIFDFLKFRSMRNGADKELKNLLHLNQYSNLKSNETDLCGKCMDDGKICKKIVDHGSTCSDANDRDNNLQDDALFLKFDNDPRVTKLGTFLRKSSLDELPQLINVLKGDMSIVGNRPLPLYEARQLTQDGCAERFLAPAGITGLWQISKRGKAEMSAEERIELDIEYARKRSVIYDFIILLKTIPALLQEESV